MDGKQRVQRGTDRFPGKGRRQGGRRKASPGGTPYFSLWFFETSHIIQGRPVYCAGWKFHAGGKGCRSKRGTEDPRYVQRAGRQSSVCGRQTPRNGAGPGAGSDGIQRGTVKGKHWACGIWKYPYSDLGCQNSGWTPGRVYGCCTVRCSLFRTWNYGKKAGH